MKTGTGIEITSTGIHYVELEKTLEGYNLVSAISIPTEVFHEDFNNLDSTAIDSVKDTVSKYFNSGAINKSGVVGFSGNGLMLRYSRVMPAPLKRQQMLIDFEIQEMSAHGSDNLISAYQKLNIATPSGEDTILVSLAKDDYLETMNAKLRKVGFSAKYFSPSCIALYNNLLMSGQMIDDQSVMVASIDKDSTEIVIVEDGVLIFARNLNTGGKIFVDILRDKKPELTPIKAWNYLLSKGDITPPVSGGEGTGLQVSLWGGGEELFRMLESSINFARLQLRKPRLDIRKIYVTGEMAKLTGVKEFMMSRFQRTVELLNPFQEFDKKLLSKTIGKKQTMMLARNPFPYAVAAGLAKMAVDEDPFTLVMKPSSYNRKMNFLYQTMFLYMALIALVITLVFQVINNTSEAKAMETVKKSVVSKNAAFKNDAKKFEKLIRESEERAPIGNSLLEAIMPSRKFYSLCRIVREYADTNPDMIVQSIEIVPYQETTERRVASSNDKEFSRSLLEIKIHFEDTGAKPLEQLNNFKKYLRERADVKPTDEACDEETSKTTKCYIVTVEL